MILTYALWSMNMILTNIVLLNFVIALISQVYEDVMNSQKRHIYVQRQELNDECDRFFSYLEDVKFWNKKNASFISQMVIVNCNIDDILGEEWQGVIQTLKRFILEKVMTPFEKNKT